MAKYAIASRWPLSEGHWQCLAPEFGLWMRASSEESGLTFENDRVDPSPLKRGEANSHLLGRPRRPRWGMFSKANSFMIRISSSQNIGYSPQGRFNGSRRPVSFPVCDGNERRHLRIRVPDNRAEAGPGCHRVRDKVSSEDTSVLPALPHIRRIRSRPSASGTQTSSSEVGHEVGSTARTQAMLGLEKLVAGGSSDHPFSPI
jgi:hypothetical protein